MLRPNSARKKPRPPQALPEQQDELEQRSREAEIHREPSYVERIEPLEIAEARLVGEPHSKTALQRRLPVRPLDRFYTRVVDGRLQVGPRFSVNSELKRFSPRYPGEDLDGIGQYLYPSRPSQRKLPSE